MSDRPLDPSQAWQDARAAFQQIWGYDDFRPPQGEIVRCLLQKRDALVVMPTGGGKSICFQLPALLQTGVTLAISPLVALMENQVQELRDRRLNAASLHGELSKSQKRQTLQRLDQNRLRLLYLSPETLLSPPIWERLCQPHIPINGLILDEAHCLVQWGDTFRPTYRRLGAIRSALLKVKPTGTQIAIAAFTATADPRAQSIIRQTLKLRQPQQFLINPYRANLHLSVRRTCTPKSRQNALLHFIQARSPQSGLVYVRTRRDSEELAEWLHDLGYPVRAYHAGLSPDLRRAIETDWIGGEIQFTVCTSAFGMGINKPDCRWVIHYQAPALLSEYVQEVGRAGRDGQPAEALTLASEPTGWLDPQDKQRRKFLLERLRSQYRRARQLARQLPQRGNVSEAIRQYPDGAIALSLLHSAGQLRWRDPFHFEIDRSISPKPPTAFAAYSQLEQYLKTRDCRWRFLLRAFGFQREAERLQRCGSCDNCVKNST